MANKVNIEDFSAYETKIGELKELANMSDIYNTLNSIDSAIKKSIGDNASSLKDFNRKNREVADNLKELINITSELINTSYKNYFDTERKNKELTEQIAKYNASVNESNRMSIQHGGSVIDNI